MAHSLAARLPKRRLAAAVAIASIALALARDGEAESVQVPLELQAELLVKLAPYDRHFAERAQERVHVLVVVNADDAESRHSAELLSGALAQLDRIGGLPHDEAVLPFQGAMSLAAACRERRVSIVYVSSGLSGQIPDIRGALDGIDVLSASAVPDYVPQGIVLGFEASSGHPKLTLNLAQARKQNVALAASVMKLMKVYE